MTMLFRAENSLSWASQDWIHCLVGQAHLRAYLTIIDRPEPMEAQGFLIAERVS